MQRAIESLLKNAYVTLQYAHFTFGRVAAHRPALEPGGAKAASAALYSGVTRPVEMLLSTIRTRSGIAQFELGVERYAGTEDRLGFEPQAPDLARAERAPRSRAPELPELRRQVFDGVVKRFEGQYAFVLLECDGRQQRRRMSREELGAAGVRFEGQAFTIVIREVRRPNGRPRKEVDIDPVGDPNVFTTKPVATPVDISRFKDLP